MIFGGRHEVVVVSTKVEGRKQFHAIVSTKTKDPTSAPHCYSNCYMPRVTPYSSLYNRNYSCPLHPEKHYQIYGGP